MHQVTLNNMKNTHAVRANLILSLVFFTRSSLLRAVVDKHQDGIIQYKKQKYNHNLLTQKEAS